MSLCFGRKDIVFVSWRDLVIFQAEEEGIDILYRQEAEAKPRSKPCLMNINEVWT